MVPFCNIAYIDLSPAYRVNRLLWHVSNPIPGIPNKKQPNSGYVTHPTVHYISADD